MRNHITREPSLTWRRAYDPTYTAVAPINGEAGAFVATVTRINGVYVCRVTTYGRPQDLATFRLLADAKAHAANVYAVVEGVNA